MITITKLNDKSVMIDRGGIVKWFTEPFYASCEDDDTGVISIYNTQETYTGLPENLTVNGVSGFTTPDEAIAAIADCFASFKSSTASGSGGGAETDPIAMARFNVYFDASGHLRPGALPAQSGVPVELLPSAPTTPAQNTMYVFPNAGVYQMQFWDGTQWQVVGDFCTDFDITDYPTTDDLDAALAGYISNTELNTALTGYATTTQLAGKQNTTTALHTGKVLTGGTVPGTFGALDIDTVPVQGSTNLITSGAVEAAVSAGVGAYVEEDPVAMPALENHILTDAARWQDYQTTKLQIAEVDANLKGYELDMAAMITNASPGASYSMQVTNGILMISYTNENGSFTTVTQNGTEQFSTEGMTEGINLQFVYNVGYTSGNKTVVVTNADSIMYIPLKEADNPINAAETDPVAMPILEAHMQTDSTRWQDFFIVKGDVGWNTAAKTGYIPDTSATEINTSPGTSISYLVKKGEYKRFVFQYTNADGQFATIMKNSQVAYTSEGIVEGVLMTNLLDVPVYPVDQTFVFNNMSLIEIVPYIQDPNRLARLDDITAGINTAIELDHQVVDTEYQTQVNTPIDKATGEQLVTADELAAHSERDLTSIAAAHNDSIVKIADLQNQILDMKASISNKTINGQTAIDIRPASQTSYTFSNELGGRLVGQGVRTIGLLGIVLLSTGTVSVNGVEVYNNTSLIGVGDAAILNTDINDGDVITSSGMNTLTVTSYVVG